MYKPEPTSEEKTLKAALGPTGPVSPTGATGPINSGREPVVLKKEDRLEVENLQLHIMLLHTQKQAYVKEAQARINQFDADLTAFNKQVELLKERLWDEYGIDFTKEVIEPGTGVIRPR